MSNVISLLIVAFPIWEIKTNLIGEYIMEALSNLDQVAYVRFASVYKNFREVKDFEDFLDNLEEK